jgi:hypothetical protein
VTFSASSEASFSGMSKAIWTSPRSMSARLVAADGTSRMMIRRTWGSGPPTQSSLRS